MLNYYKQKFYRQRIKAILLLALSLLLLFSNWIVSTGSTKYDWSEYRDDLSSLSENIDDIADFFGVSINTSSAARSVGYLLNGKITPVEGALIAKDLLPILNEFSDGSEESVAFLVMILFIVTLCLSIFLKEYELYFRISLFSMISLVCAILSSVYWNRLPLAEFVPNEKPLPFLQKLHR